jgi:hypothetical protein
VLVELRDEVAEPRLVDPLGGVLGREPLQLPLVLLAPLLELPLHDEEIDGDVAQLEMIRAPLPVGVRADRVLPDPAEKAGLFLGLPGGGLVVLEAFMGQPFGMTQRRVSRDVISRTSTEPLSVKRMGRAAICAGSLSTRRAALADISV